MCVACDNRLVIVSDLDRSSFRLHLLILKYDIIIVHLRVPKNLHKLIFLILNESIIVSNNRNYQPLSVWGDVQCLCIVILIGVAQITIFLPFFEILWFSALIPVEREQLLPTASENEGRVSCHFYCIVDLIRVMDSLHLLKRLRGRLWKDRYQESKEERNYLHVIG